MKITNTDLKEFTELLEGVEVMLENKLNTLKEASAVSKVQERISDLADSEKAQAEENLVNAKIRMNMVTNEKDAEIQNKNLQKARLNLEQKKAKAKEEKSKKRMLKTLRTESSDFTLSLTKKTAPLQEEAKPMIPQHELYQYAISREVGDVINYLLNGIEPANVETLVVAQKLSKSAITKNIAFKLCKELDKVRPDKIEIKKLRHELSVEISKCKRGN